MRSRGRTPRAFAASALVATFAVATFVLSSRVGRVSLDGAVRDAALLEAVEALRTTH